MERTLHRIKGVSVVGKLLLVITIHLVVPVVGVLIEDALVVLLLQASEVAVLAEELTLQRIGARDALRGAEDVSGILLSGTELILNALLIDARVARQIGLLGVDLVLDLLLCKLGRLVVVLEQQIVRAVGKVLGQRVLVLLQLLVIGRTTKCTALCELRCHGWRRTVLVGVRDVRVRLVDHRLQLRILAHIWVGTDLRRLTEIRVTARCYVELAVGDTLQRLRLDLLCRASTLRTNLSLRHGIPLPRSELSNRLPAVLLVGLIVDRLSLVDQVLVIVRQPARQIDLGGGRGVLRL